MRSRLAGRPSAGATTVPSRMFGPGVLAFGMPSTVSFLTSASARSAIAWHSCGVVPWMLTFVLFRALADEPEVTDGFVRQLGLVYDPLTFSVLGYRKQA